MLENSKTVSPAEKLLFYQEFRNISDLKFRRQKLRPVLSQRIRENILVEVMFKSDLIFAKNFEIWIYVSHRNSQN